MPLVKITKKKLGLSCYFLFLFGLSQLAFSSFKDFHVKVKDWFGNEVQRGLVNFENIERSYHCEVVYVGCYALDLKEKDFVSQFDMTRDQCLQICSKKQLFWVGLTNGSICVCSSIVNTMADPFKHGMCDLPCSGNENEKCGGKDGIDVIQLLSHCFEGTNTTNLFEEDRYLGCFNNDKKNLFGEVKFLVPTATISPTKLCILQCSMEHYPLAALNSNNTKCDCGWFTRQYNLTQQIKTCGASSLKIYRTLSPDNRCSYPQFLPSNSLIKRAIFTSIQGSGNTWSRHLIEKAAGIFSTTKNRDIPLAKAGFFGELVKENYEGVFLIKRHPFEQKFLEQFNFHSVLLIVRNPYYAFIAEYNRMKSGKNHVGIADEKMFQTKGFFGFVKRVSRRWRTHFLSVLKSDLPHHVFFYENLIQDPILETRKIIKFFEVNNGFQQPALEERLLCLEENLQGTQKRKPRKFVRDPYTEEMVAKINSEIAKVREYIVSRNISLILPPYERN